MKAVTVWTPLHLLNALKYICSRDLQGSCVLYYISQSAQMDRYLKNLEKENIFAKIYSTTREKQNRNQKLWEIVGAVSPSAYVRHMFGNDSVNHEYDEILFAVPTRLNDCICSANRYRALCGLDDGLGSYIGDVFKTDLGRKYTTVSRMAHHKAHTVSKVILNNPDFYMGDSDRPREKVAQKELTSEQKRAVLRIFDYDDKETYEGIDLLFLNQPLADFHDTSAHTETEQQILSCIADQKNLRCAVRLHPREQMDEIYSGFKKDQNRNMWELMCSDAVNEKMCLLSAFSTAQIMPKLLFDKEPSLIFTFLLYSDFSEKERTQYAGLCERLKNIYRDKDKVYIPESFDELRTILEKSESVKL